MPVVNNSLALDAHETPRPAFDFEHVGLLAVFGVAGALQFSIAAAQILLTLAVLCWLGLIVVRRERFEAPGFFWPLAIYALLTLVSAAFSFDPRASFIDSKQ